MLDTRRIGAYISRLRKEQDLTQMELAEQLNVSHQAVSKWERGQSLPDIGTLPRMAEMFNISIDQIMNAGEIRENSHIGKIVEEVRVEKPENIAVMINSGEVEAAELTDVAPILKASTLNRVAEGLDITNLNKEFILSLAPFLGSEALEGIVRQAMDEVVNWGVVAELAPFLGSGFLYELVEKLVQEGSLGAKELVRLSPFLDRQSLDQLLQAIDLHADWDLVLALAPFLSKDTINRLVDQGCDGELEAARLVQLAPFLGKDQLDQLVLQAEEGKVDWKVVVSLAPFLSKETLDRLVEHTIDGKIETNRMVSLAPFLSKDSIQAILARVDVNDLDTEVLAGLAPFAGKGTLSKLVTTLMLQAK